MTQRLVFALDLVDDADLIATYEDFHRPGAVWPEVLADIRARGVQQMEIWRTGDRLVMVCEVAEDFSRSVPAGHQSKRWEEMMDRFQRRLPHASPGEKWTPMRRIFDLTAGNGSSS